MARPIYTYTIYTSEPAYPPANKTIVCENVAVNGYIIENARNAARDAMGKLARGEIVHESHARGNQIFADVFKDGACVDKLERIALLYPA